MVQKDLDVPETLSPVKEQEGSARPRSAVPRLLFLSLVGLELGTAIVAFAVALGGVPFHPAFAWAIAGAAVAALGLVGVAVEARRRIYGSATAQDADALSYSLYLLSVGVLLLASGLVATVAVAILIINGVLAFPVDPSRAAADEPMRQATHVLTAGGLALVGALFFTANTLSERGFGEPEKREPFDVGHFWSGAALRMGEATLFTLVVSIFLVEEARLPYGWLPLFGLVFGMFVKTAEKVVFGIARRLFRAVTVLVEPEQEVVRNERSSRRDTDEHPRPERGEPRSAAADRA